MKLHLILTYIFSKSYLKVLGIADQKITNTTLSYISYVIAIHPNEQQKLQEHIDAHYDLQTKDDTRKIHCSFRMLR